MRFKSLVLVSALAAAGTANAGVLTYWDFNNQNNTPSIGTGTVSLQGGVTSPGYNSDNGSSDPAATAFGLQTTSYPAASTGDKTAGVAFFVSTLGMQDISFSFDLRTSNTASRYFLAQYTTDGSTWNDSSLFTSAGGDTWNNTNTVNLSGISAVNNNANFGFRVVATFAPGTSNYAASRTTVATNYSSAGTYRFDTVSVSGDVQPVPEPASMVALGLGAAAMLRRRRKA